MGNDGKEFFLNNEQLNQMSKEEVIEHCNKCMNQIKEFYQAYKIVPRWRILYT